MFGKPSVSVNLSCFLLPASCFLLPASCFLLPASCFLLPASCFLLPASCFLLISLMERALLSFASYSLARSSLV
ncbi:MAG: hypothetical protein ACRDCY_13705 [Aeromonas veronii]